VGAVEVGETRILPRDVTAHLQQKNLEKEERSKGADELSMKGGDSRSKRKLKRTKGSHIPD